MRRASILLFIDSSTVSSIFERLDSSAESRGTNGVVLVRAVQQSTFFETFETAAAGEAGLAMLMQATSSEDTKIEGRRGAPFGDLNESQIEQEIRSI